MSSRKPTLVATAQFAADGRVHFNFLTQMMRPVGQPRMLYCYDAPLDTSRTTSEIEDVECRVVEART